MSISKNYKHLLIAIIIFIALVFVLPVDYGLTKIGGLTLALIISTVYLWLTVGLDWPSLLALALVCLFRSLGSSGAVFSNSLGNMSIIYAMVVIIINNTLAEYGIIQHIAYWFLSRKFLHNKPWAFISMFIFSSWVIGLFMDQSALMLAYIPLITSVCTMTGYEKGDKFGTVLMFGSLCGISLGYGATPIGHVVPSIMMGMIAATTGQSLSVFTYSAVGIPLTFVLILLIILFLRFAVKVDTSKFQNFDASKTKLEPVSRDGKIVIVVFIALVICWLFPDILRYVLPAAASFMGSQGIAVPPMIAVALLSILKSKNTDKPIISYTKAVNSVPWQVLVFVGTIMVFTATINTDITGIRVFLSHLFSPLTRMFSPLMLVFIGLLFTVLVTNLISSAVTQAVFFSLLAPILLGLPGLPIRVEAVGIMIAIITSVSIMTPPASGHTPYAYSSGYIKIKDGFTLGLPIAIISWVVCIVFWPLAALVVR